MNLLTVDPGFSQVGWALWREHENLERPALHDYGVFQFTSERESFNDKLNDVLKQLWDAFAQIVSDSEIDTIAWERVPLLGGFSSQSKVVSTSTILKCLCFQNNLEWYEVHSQSAKRLFLGNGRATKQEVADKVVSLYPDSVKLGKKWDGYDAIMIGCIFDEILKEAK